MTSAEPVTDFDHAAAPRRVLVLIEDDTRAEELSRCIEERGMSPAVCTETELALVSIYNEPPDLIILHEGMGPRGGVEMARMLKQDNVFAHLPVLLIVLPENLDALLASEDFPFDDYISDQASNEELLARAILCLLRALRQLDANPLTRLPGNNSITKELERRLGRKEAFATVYVDLDNFKAFNDRYGFARGDQAIQMTARLMVNSVSAASPRDYYVGHVGGDDFVFMLPMDLAEEACKQFIKNFDAIITSLYDDTDRKQGYIRSKNRKGEVEVFPLMTISLAVAVNKDAQFEHPGQISAVSAELKKVLKKREYSSYIIDRRTYSRRLDDEDEEGEIPWAKTEADPMQPPRRDEA